MSENPIRGQLSVNRHGQELLSDETSSRTIKQVIQHRLIGLGHWASEPVHLKRPYGVSGSPALPSFQLSRRTPTLEGSFTSSRPTKRPGTTEEGFCGTCFCLIASLGRLPVSLVTSPFRAAMTAGSLFTHSRDRSPDASDLMCISTSSCACWCPNSRSAKVRLKRSTTPWSLWMSTRPRLTETPCFARSWPAAPINSRPGSTWRSLGHFRGPRL